MDQPLISAIEKLENISRSAQTSDEQQYEEPTIESLQYNLNQQNEPNETSPLLEGTSQRIHGVETQNILMTVLIVVLMLLFLTSGVIIAVYLLHEEVPKSLGQPLFLVTPNEKSHLTSKPWLKQELKSSVPVQKVFVTETGTQQCYNYDDCTTIVVNKLIDKNATQGTLCNFFISSEGVTYEGTGWKYSYMPQSLLIGVIGNFSNFEPPEILMIECEALLDDAVARGALDVDYKLYAQKNTHTHEPPLYLERALSKLREFEFNYE